MSLTKFSQPLSLELKSPCRLDDGFEDKKAFHVVSVSRSPLSPRFLHYLLFLFSCSEYITSQNLPQPYLQLHRIWLFLTLSHPHCIHFSALNLPPRPGPLLPVACSEPGPEPALITLAASAALAAMTALFGNTASPLLLVFLLLRWLF